MRKLEALRNTPDGCDYTLSLVPQGWTQGQEAKAVFGFVPRYELGVLKGLDVFNPRCVFHFADKATANEMYHKIAQAIIQDGLYGKPLAKVVHDADPKKVDARWAPSWRPMAESERFETGDVTQSEAAEFSDRMAQYRNRTEKRIKGMFTKLLEWIGMALLLGSGYEALTGNWHQVLINFGLLGVLGFVVPGYEYFFGRSPGYDHRRKE